MNLLGAHDDRLSDEKVLYVARTTTRRLEVPMFEVRILKLHIVSTRDFGCLEQNEVISKTTIICYVYNRQKFHNGSAF